MLKCRRVICLICFAFRAVWKQLSKMVNKKVKPCVISGFRRKVDENSAFLGYCVACSGKSLPTIRDRPLKMEPIGCPETSVRNCHYTLRNSPEEHSSLLQKGKVVPVHTIQACRGRRGIAPTILSLCTEWR